MATPVAQHSMSGSSRPIAAPAPPLALNTEGMAARTIAVIDASDQLSPWLASIFEPYSKTKNAHETCPPQPQNHGSQSAAGRWAAGGVACFAAYADQDREGVEDGG